MHWVMARLVHHHFDAITPSLALFSTVPCYHVKLSNVVLRSSRITEGERERRKKKGKTYH